MKQNTVANIFLCGLLFLFAFNLICIPPAAGWKFHADLNNSGVYDDGGIRPNNIERWNFSTQNFNVRSNPAYYTGTVYIGGADWKVYALNVSTGVHVWNYTTGGQVQSSPAVINGLVYFGSYDTKVYALFANNGSKLWEYTTGGTITSSPSVINNIVYIGSDNGRLYALYANNGSKLWEFTQGGTIIATSPAVDRGIVYIGNTFEHKIYALNATTGLHIWNYSVGTDIYSSPAIANGLVYFGASSGHVFAFNATTGASAWSYLTGGNVESTPAVAGGVVYVGSDDNKIYALNATTGAHLWDFTTNNDVYSNPAVANGRVYFGGLDSKVYALNASTGSEIWNYTTGVYSIYSSPSVANGVLYIGCDDGKVYAFGAPPAANFSANVTSGVPPLAVQFTDTSSGFPTSWNWSFGDGTFSTSQNPSHVYSSIGSFTVSLNATDAHGSGITIKTNYVTVGITPIIANFTANVTSGTAPLPISFTDQSLNTPTGWAWFFGDENFTAPWIEVNSSAGWSTRRYHNSVVMPDGSIVLMGGIELSGNKNDTWQSTNNGATWTEVNASTGWSARFGHTSVVMPDGSIVLMGGWDGSDHHNDVWRSTDNGATWTEVNASAGWSPRSFQTSVVLANGNIVLMGGQGSANNNDVWRSTDNGATWTEVNASAGWSPRLWHSSVVMPDGSIILMGGHDGSGYKNDTWLSTDNGATWTEVNASAGWPARTEHSGVVMPDGSIVLMGGEWDDGTYYFLDDVWRSTDNGVTWTEVNASAGWPARYGHSSVAMPDGSIVLTGGFGIDGWENDVWRFIPVGSSIQNPSHTYTTPGTYQVALQVYNTGGYNSTRKAGYITVTGLPDINVTDCLDITEPGIYALRNDISSTSADPCINISCSDVLFRGNGFTISGVNTFGSKGVYVYHPSVFLANVSISNLTLTNWGYGVLYHNVDGGRIENVTAASNADVGIWLDSVYNLIVANNVIVNNWQGIYIIHSKFLSLFNNTLTSNSEGFGLQSDEFIDDEWNHTITLNNTINGRPIYYVRNVADSVYDGSTNAGTFYCINCTNVTVKDLTISQNPMGMTFNRMFNSTIENITIYNNDFGVRIFRSDYNTVRQSNISFNSYGIDIAFGFFNTITNSTFLTNSFYGIHLAGSGETTIINNTVSGTSFGSGISIVGNGFNTISSNIIENNGNFGIDLTGGSSDNLIYNNWFSNTWNANDGTSNIWNITKTLGTNIVGGSYLGGNYWNDYTGIDTDGDGIGDTLVPYTSGGNITTGGDWLPLTTSGVSSGPIHNLNSGLNYTTIQNAIDDATSGDTILVDSGTYYENVEVTKQLTLRGVDTGSGQPIVNADYTGDAITISSDEVTIDGFVASEGYSGVRVYSNNNTFTNNTASYNSEGFYLDFESSNNTLTGNTAHDNSYDGFYVYSDSNNNTLTGNTAHDNSYEGFYLESSSDYNTLTGNTAYNNTEGFYLYSSSNNILTDNTAYNNSQSGFYLGESWYNTITGVTATGNGGPGIYITGGEGPTEHNIIRDVYSAANTQCGIYIYSGNFNTIENVTSDDNDTNGITIEYGDSNQIINSTITENFEYGISLIGSTNTLIERSDVRNNDIKGIYLDSSSTNSIYNSSIEGNGEYGIYLNSLSFSNTIYNNKFNNTLNVVDEAESTNIWNLTSKTLGTNIIGGQYLGGNYWSDYTGIDTDGDGIGNSDLPYNSLGNITLGGDWLPLTNNVSAPVPFADFTSSPASGVKPLTVVLADLSIGTPTTWNWSFGDSDNTNATVQNPVHTYQIPGIYTISLNVTNASGYNTTTKTNYIWVDYPEVAMFHGDARHTGVYDDGGTAPANYIKWNFTTGDSVQSSPAVADGNVYFGSYDDKVYAVNASTGSEVWNFTTAGDVYSSPAVADGIVYVGSAGFRIYALGATNGTEIWNHVVGAGVLSSPAPAYGIVYVGCSDGKIYALNASTGATVWDYQTGAVVESSPAVAGGRVFVGSRDWNVSALDAGTGALLWNYTTSGYVDSSPAVADGVVYVGSDDYNIYALNATTGAKIWNYTLLDKVFSSPAVANGIVYVGSNGADANISAFDATEGTLMWDYHTFNAVGTSPAVAGGIVYAGSSDGRLFAFNASTGEKLWDYNTGVGIASSPAVNNGVLYIGSNNRMYALGGTPAPIASFTTNVTSGTAPLAVNFTDLSTNTPTSWNWSFGDGNFSVLQNPVHLYEITGTFTVSLNAINAGGSNVSTRINYIVVNVPAPVASFSANVTSGYAPLPVQFNDTSTGSPTSWNWSFGDIGAGNSSLLQNPVHTYTTYGNFTVNLTSENSGGSNTFQRLHYIAVRIRGDLNSNGYVDIGDVTSVAYMGVGLMPADIQAADFNGNGRIDIGDASKIVYYYIGKIGSL